MLSVIIPAFNSEKFIDPLLSGLARTALKDYEVIVVDDASADSTVRLCRDRGAQVLALEKNGGPAKARNEGAARARGDILVFADTDVLFPADRDVLSGMDRIFRERPGVDCVSTISHVDPLSESAIAYNASVYHAYYMENLLRGRPRVEGRIMLFTSRLGAIRREKFREVGGFHETLYTVMAEDAEFAARCYHRGFVSCVDKELFHYHRYGSGLKKFAKSYFLGATVKALVDRKFDSSADATVSGREKLRRLFALGLLASPALLGWCGARAWLLAFSAAALLFVASFERMLALLWRHVPGRLLLPWFLTYVLITPVVLAGYLRGVWLSRRGTRLLEGPSSLHPFFQEERRA